VASTSTPKIASDWDDRFEETLERARDYFMGQSDVHRAAAALAQRLDALGIPYAVAGAVALGAHGYRRLTEDVDVLLTRDGLARFKQAHLGRGYVEKFAGSKGMRDTENDVGIDVLLAGDFPGDGKPKPVAFPDPATVRVHGERFRVLELPRLLELKLASGMSAPHRLKDLADVLETIRALKLPREFAQSLDASVRGKFEELWDAAEQGREDE
jgi:hypothetical protein